MTAPDYEALAVEVELRRCLRADDDWWGGYNIACEDIAKLLREKARRKENGDGLGTSNKCGAADCEFGNSDFRGRGHLAPDTEAPSPTGEPLVTSHECTLESAGYINSEPAKPSLPDDVAATGEPPWHGSNPGPNGEGLGYDSKPDDVAGLVTRLRHWHDHAALHGENRNILWNAADTIERLAGEKSYLSDEVLPALKGECERLARGISDRDATIADNRGLIDAQAVEIERLRTKIIALEHASGLTKVGHERLLADSLTDAQAVEIERLRAEIEHGIRVNLKLQQRIERLKDERSPDHTQLAMTQAAEIERLREALKEIRKSEGDFHCGPDGCFASIASAIARAALHDSGDGQSEAKADNARLREALEKVRAAILTHAPDTLWIGLIETAVDHIDAALKDSGDGNAK